MFVCSVAGGITCTQVCVLVKKCPAVNTARGWEVSLSAGWTLIFREMSKKCSLQTESLLFGLNGYEGFYQEALVGGLGQISGFSLKKKKAQLIKTEFNKWISDPTNHSYGCFKQATVTKSGKHTPISLASFNSNTLHSL